MKLVLVQPPIEDFYDTDVRLQPIGLAYLAGAVRKRLPDVDVEILDFHHGFGRRTLPLPKELSYLREYYPCPDESPFSTFHQYYRFGASDFDMARVLKETRPDVVGISSLFTPYSREALSVARLVKEHTGATVVMGGSHVSADPESVLREPAVDFIVTGEGERALVDLLRAIAAGAPSPRWFNREDESEPIEEIPIPDLSSLSRESYLFRGRPMTFLVTSRSCPHRCSFCSVHATFGFRYRRVSVPRVLEEMKLRYREGYRVFDFEDDNLTYYQDEMKELCRGIQKEFPSGDIELLAMNGISYLSLDEELLELMKSAGFTRLNLALVSSDTTVLETTKRPHTVSKYLKVVEAAHRLGFAITSYQILGLPFESLSSMAQTLVFSARLPVLQGASPFYLTPGSPIQRHLGIELTEADHFRARLTAMAWEGRDFTRDDVYTLFITTRILNFLKSRDESSLSRTSRPRAPRDSSRERSPSCGKRERAAAPDAVPRRSVLRRLAAARLRHGSGGQSNRDRSERVSPHHELDVLATVGSEGIDRVVRTGGHGLVLDGRDLLHRLVAPELEAVNSGNELRGSTDLKVADAGEKAGTVLDREVERGGKVGYGIDQPQPRAIRAGRAIVVDGEHRRRIADDRNGNGLARSQSEPGLDDGCRPPALGKELHSVLSRVELRVRTDAAVVDARRQRRAVHDEVDALGILAELGGSKVRLRNRSGGGRGRGRRLVSRRRRVFVASGGEEGQESRQESEAISHGMHLDASEVARPG